VTTPAGTVKPLAWYALACVGCIGLATAVFRAVYPERANWNAVLLSAVVGLVVQVAAFALARIFARKGHGIAGWGIGALICLLSLVAYGITIRALGLPQNAALISLATFFSLTELIEAPLLIG
jgi:hypothetical protein